MSPKLPLGFALTGVLAVVAAAVSATEVSLRCAAAAFGLLAWQALRARDAAPRVRWALAGGALLFAVAALVRSTDRPEDVGWFAYGPPDEARLTAMLDVACRAFGRELTTAGVQLGAVVLLAGAVHALPGVARRSRTVAASIAAGVLAAVILADRWVGVDLDELLPSVRAVWPGLLAAATGLLLLVLAGRRADHRWWVAAGAALVAVHTAVTQSDLTGSWWSVVALSELADGHTFSSLAVSTAVPGGPEFEPALRTAVMLAGPALLVSGALRAATRPGER